jgi:hypothetical protein
MLLYLKSNAPASQEQCSCITKAMLLHHESNAPCDVELCSFISRVMLLSPWMHVTYGRGRPPCLPVECGREVRYCSGRHGGLPLRVDEKHLISIVVLFLG